MRTKLAKRLLNFGTRVQYSVFECEVNKKQLRELKTQIMEFVDPEVDSLRIYKLCDACVQLIESHGTKEGRQEDDAVVI